MSKSTDKLAFALSTPKPLSRQYFRNVFDHLYLTDAVPAGYKLEDIDRYRRATELSLEALAICDFEFRDRQTVHSCPPYLGLLPRSGFPEVVLFGARTPLLRRQLLATVRKHRDSASISITGQPGFPLLPNRIRIQAENLPTLRAIAQTSGIPLLEIAPSWLLLSYALVIEEYMALLPWKVGAPDLNWHRDDFDTLTLSFQATLAGSSLHLTRYRHPQHAYRQLFYLVDGERFAEVDPAWGRYYVLQRLDKNVLLYDEQLAVALLPSFLPLPRLLARGLVGCSGVVPQEVSGHGRHRLRAFVQVPQSHADLLAHKLGQKLTRTRLSKPPKEAND